MEFCRARHAVFLLSKFVADPSVAVREKLSRRGAT